MEMRMHRNREFGYVFGGRGFVGLKFWILSLVSKKEMTGAQIMDTIEELSIGAWRPSPGNIYPALQQLVAAGFINAKEENNQKYYFITDKGEAMLSSLAPFTGMRSRFVRANASAEDTLLEIEGYISYLERHASLDASRKKKALELAERLERLAK
ncbi:MAG: PadR family transcriptional regulator [Candidatus Micrarchaeaceae archaeon]